MPKAEQVRLLELDLDAWFVERLQGYGTRVEGVLQDSQQPMIELDRKLKTSVP